MAEFLQVMLWPFLACLVLAGIHAYLGLHVIEREVIFVDLALAQIAAVGAGVAMMLGHDLHGAAAYWTSLGFTLIGAAIFAGTRYHKPRVPQEATIGIVYAVAAALLVVVLSRSGEGDEHIRETLVGNVLLVRPGEVVKIAWIYGAIGLFHFVFRSRFLAVTRDPLGASRSMNLRFWDFVFYATFGVVVTSSVRIAGVLLVFSFLIVPAACAMLFADRVRTRLALGWTVGFAGSVLGMAASYALDVPTGAAVICAFGAIIVSFAVVRYVLSLI